MTDSAISASVLVGQVRQNCLAAGADGGISLRDGGKGRQRFGIMPAMVHRVPISEARVALVAQ